MGRPDTHRVEITVSSAGEFTYSLDPIRANRGDVIEWTCDSGDWSIQIAGLQDQRTKALQRGKTPFERGQMTTKANRKAANGLTVAADAAFGTYKYTVQVKVAGNEFEDDPEIIIGGRD